MLCRELNRDSIPLFPTLQDPGISGVSQNSGYLFGGPYNKDYRNLGSILGVP